jgi:signal transduction histidine kinase
MADPVDPWITEALVSLANSREAEMARVARVLHDDLGPILSAAGLQLDALRMDFREQASEVAARTAEIQKLLERAIDRVRELSYELNPATVDRAGLYFALERLSNRVRSSFQGAVNLSYDPSVRLPPPVAKRIYQIVECALDNAVRHSGATIIDILARLSKESIIAEVADNGRGFSFNDPAVASKGLGLAFMRMHARLGGLNLTIESRTGEGSVIKVAYSAPGAPARETDGMSA